MVLRVGERKRKRKRKRKREKGKEKEKETVVLSRGMMCVGVSAVSLM